MATHPHDDSRRTPHGQNEDVIGGEDLEASSKETQIGKKAASPTQISKKAAPNTQVAADQAGAPESPPQLPSLSIDADEIVEAESMDEEVIDVQPASGVAPAATTGGSGVVEVAPMDEAAVDAAFADDADVLGADALQSGSSLRRGAESPPALEAHPASDIITAESADSEVRAGDEVLLGEHAAPASGSFAKPESDIQREAARRGKPEPVDLESTELADAAPASDVLEASEAFDDVEEAADEAIAAEASDGDDSSAVDFGRMTKGSSSQLGVDPVAEALESGVNLEAAPTSKRLPVPSVEMDDLLEEGGAQVQTDQARRRDRSRHGRAGRRRGGGG